MPCKRSRHQLCAHTYDHHGRRHVGLAVSHRPQLLQHIDQCRIVLGRLIHERREADCAVFPFDIEVVFERDGQPMEGSYRLTGSLEVLVEGLCLLNSLIEEGIAETIGLNARKLTFPTISSGFAIPVAEQLQRVCRTRP